MSEEVVTPFKCKCTVKIPRWAICPITLDLMDEPVVCEHGYSFEKSAYYKYKREFCPMSNKSRTRMPSGNCYRPAATNYALREAIASLKMDEAFHHYCDESPVMGERRGKLF